MNKKIIALGLGVVLTAMSFGTVLANEPVDQKTNLQSDFGLGFGGEYLGGEARAEQLCLDEERMQQLADEAGMSVEEFIAQFQAERAELREQRMEERALLREQRMEERVSEGRQGQFAGQKGKAQRVQQHNNS